MPPWPPRQTGHACEKEGLFAFAKAGTLLSILQSKARRTLKIKLKKRTST